MPNRDPKRQLPLTAVVLHILLALADGDLHGYAIAAEIERATNGEIRTGPGTMYGSISRMLDAELIEEVSKRPASSDDERRRYYRTTAFGRRVLSLEVERLSEVLQLARSKRVLRGSGAA
ncbi:MAG: helix-turn-helix transcriptional regulator [Gemmatimonadaceae bacterium]